MSTISSFWSANVRSMRWQKGIYRRPLYVSFDLEIAVITAYALIYGLRWICGASIPQTNTDNDMEFLNSLSLFELLHFLLRGKLEIYTCRSLIRCETYLPTRSDPFKFYQRNTLPNSRDLRYHDWRLFVSLEEAVLVHEVVLATSFRFEANVCVIQSLRRSGCGCFLLR